MSRDEISGKTIESYRVVLREKYRPPSRGGNTRALHAHVLRVENEEYSFLALGSQQWVHKGDLVSFQFEVKNGYKNILKDTLVTIDSGGRPVVRGNRGFKKRLRTADARLPASRREQRD
jgi:hypothetical protein